MTISIANSFIKLICYLSICVATFAGKRGWRRRFSSMSLWIRLRSFAVSTRDCTSCPTRNTTSHCLQAGFLSFAWRWLEPDLFTVALCAPAVLGPGLFALLSIAGFLLTLRPFVAFFFHNRSKIPHFYDSPHAKSWRQEYQFAPVEQK